MIAAGPRKLGKCWCGRQIRAYTVTWVADVTLTVEHWDTEDKGDRWQCSFAIGTNPATTVLTTLGLLVA